MPVSEAQRAELIEAVANCVSPQLAAEIEAATDPVSGSIVIVNLYDGRDAASDSGTVGINLNARLPQWFIALLLSHEYAHAKSGRQSQPNNPDAPDPDTNPSTGDSCWQCRHAQMTATDLSRMSSIICDGLLPLLPPESKEEGCQFWATGFATLEQRLINCQNAGCTSCCGAPFVPTGAFMAPVPPCCL